MLNETERCFERNEYLDEDSEARACIRARLCEPAGDVRSFDLAARVMRPARTLWQAAHFALFELKGAVEGLTDVELRTMEARSTTDAARRLLVNDFQVMRDAESAPEASGSPPPADLENWARRRLFGQDLPDALRRELVEAFLAETVCDELDPHRPAATDRPEDERRAGSNRSMAGSWLLRCTRPDEFETAREEAKRVLARICQDREVPIPESVQFACFDYFFAQSTRFRFSDRFLIWDKEPLLACARLRALLRPAARRSAPALVVSRERGAYLLFKTRAVLFVGESLCQGVVRWCVSVRESGPVAEGADCSVLTEDVLSTS